METEYAPDVATTLVESGIMQFLNDESRSVVMAKIQIEGTRLFVGERATSALKELSSKNLM